jgi:hypothetical protein
VRRLLTFVLVSLATAVAVVFLVQGGGAQALASASDAAAWWRA